MVALLLVEFAHVVDDPVQPLSLFLGDAVNFILRCLQLGVQVFNLSPLLSDDLLLLLQLSPYLVDLVSAQCEGQLVVALFVLKTSFAVLDGCEEVYELRSLL